MNILMIAAENDALAGAKVGGIADVVRDIAPALAQRSHQVQVLLPGYQSLSEQSGSQRHDRFEVTFWGRVETVELYSVPGRNPVDGVQQWVVEHPLFAAAGKGRIYCDDPPDRPFATDASKFALFCVAAAEAAKRGLFGQLDVLHLHDWHASVVALLRAYHADYVVLQSIHTVFSIHNLALQGIRPFDGDISAVHAWFPGLDIEYKRVSDPRYSDCLNLMRTGINLSDKVHAVSPTYVAEITQPSCPEQGFFGGEGLDPDLLAAQQQGRLIGILNGAEYDSAVEPKLDSELERLLLAAESEVINWMSKETHCYSGHSIALGRIQQWLRNLDQKSGDKQMLLTSVGRLTDQKVLLLRQTMLNGKSALDNLLLQLAGRGRLILLGSGDPLLEQFLLEVAGRHANFIFLRGFSIDLSELFYRAGDLFLMPSSFEPCGISQMLAMRAGQPCLVHSVGGLADTIEDGKNGFSFNGSSLHEQCQGMLDTCERAISEFSRTAHWNEICAQAAAQRFLWSDSALAYEQHLYAKGE